MDLRDTIRTYRLFSGSYDIVFGPVFHPGRKEAVRIANDRPGQRILEVGVGTGLSLPYFRADSQVTGIDVSAEMLAKARRRVERQRLHHVEASARDGRRAPRISRTIRSTPCWRSTSPRWCRTRRASPPKCAASAFPAARSSSSIISPARTGRRASSRSGWPARPPYRLSRRLPARHLPARQPVAGPRNAARAICSAIGSCCAASTKSPPPIPAEPISGTGRGAHVPGIVNFRKSDRDPSTVSVRTGNHEDQLRSYSHQPCRKPAAPR